MGRKKTVGAPRLTRSDFARLVAKRAADRQRRADFVRGARAAADVVAAYNVATSHPYRLDDCLLIKLNVKCGTPRPNRAKQPQPEDMWFRGLAAGLAAMNRRVIGGKGADATGVRDAARAAGLTLARARVAGVPAYDLRELRKAGVL